jgi:hypothetical protein
MAMRGRAVLLVLMLAGCLPGAAPTGITEQPLPPMIGAAPEAEAEAEAEAALPPEPAPEPQTAPEPDPVVLDFPAPQAPPLPPALARQQSECQRGGGTFTARAGGLYACVTPTRDAGRSCRTGADCAGLCLARSMTCAPVAPLFGCNEVLDSRGARQTLCVD